MGAVRIIRRLAQLLDVHFTDIQDGDGVVWDEATGKFINAPGGSSGAPTGPAGGVLSGTYPNPGFAADMATQAELDAEASSRASGDTAAISTAEAFATSAVAALSTVYQPLDSDLTAIAALGTTAFGRGLLADADAAALRTSAGLGTAATAATSDFDAAGAAAAGQAASQPVDSDLTAIAALTTTAFGRSFLVLADAPAARTLLGLGTLATQSGTFSGTSSGTNTGDQTTVSGNAGTATALQTSRNIDGQGFDGTASITVIAPGTHAATGKTTPVDADELPLVDSAASNVLKKLTWANLKATLKTYFDTLYLGATASAGGDLTGSYPNPTLAAAGPGATGPIGDATHVAAVTIDAKGRITTLSSVAITAPASPGGLAVYGDGSDGTVTFDGSTTILGMAPSSSVYTFSRDFYFAAATINSGVTIVTNGYRLFCAGTLTNNGPIGWNGGNGGNGTTVGGTAGAACTNASGSIFTSALGIIGVAGGTGTGSAGGAASGGFGGSGGHGGAGNSAGGAGGAASGFGASVGLTHTFPVAVFGFALTGGHAFGTILGGASGGSGGGDGTNAGGGSGGGGGLVIIVAKVIAGTGTISANGGNGGNGNTSGNTGGGGGGGGGGVTVVSSSVSAGAVSGQTITASGGTHGTSNGSGGALITNGSAGTVILLPN